MPDYYDPVRKSWRGESRIPLKKTRQVKGGLMEYIAQLIFPSLGKIDKYFPLGNELRREIKIPFTESLMGFDLSVSTDSCTSIQVMVFEFNGSMTSHGPLSTLCEYEFAGIRRYQSSDCAKDG